MTAAFCRVALIAVAVDVDLVAAWMIVAMTICSR